PVRLSVHAPFDAVVEAVENDRSPMVVLRHDRPDTEPVWSRWTGVASPLRAGDAVAAGARIGRAEPALRVALFRRWGTASWATPGSVPRWHAAAGRGVAPDPAEFVGLPAARRPAAEWDVDRVLASRSVHFGRSQRSYYRRPMNLVGGRGSWLHDDQGRAYL